MFDTVHLRKPIPCGTCGEHISEFQTKEFESVMAHYRLGSVVSGSGILSGIVKDWLFCDACNKAKRESRTDVFLVIWHSILAGVETSEAAAEERLTAVDRHDLVGWLDEAQRQERRWQGRFYELLGDLRAWRDHVEEQNRPEQEKEKKLRFLLRKPDEKILNAENPLTAILEMHQPKRGDEEPPWIW